MSRGSVSSGYEMTEVRIASNGGPIDARWQLPLGDVRRGAIVCVGGFDGGFEGPAEDLYTDLAAVLPSQGIGVLRLDFRVKRSPGPIDEGTADVLAGVHWLAEQEAGPVALVGHSYGGAIVIRACARSASVAGVAALATQTAGIDPPDLGAIAPRPLLLVHGAADWRLPARLSEWVYSMAGEGRELHILEGATHSLRQRRPELWELLIAWLDRVLRRDADE